jgi:hypothetical protein
VRHLAHVLGDFFNLFSGTSMILAAGSLVLLLMTPQSARLRWLSPPSSLSSASGTPFPYGAALADLKFPALLEGLHTGRDEHGGLGGTPPRPFDVNLRSRRLL